MPRKLVRPIIDVNSCRADAYESHFGNRQFAREYASREEVSRLVDRLSRPLLNVFGAASFKGRVFEAWPTRDMEGYYSLGLRLGLSADALFWWYWSDAGWLNFEKQWADLPNTVNIQVCTNDRIVHIRTQESFAYATG